jgi:hypothetical protein
MSEADSQSVSIARLILVPALISIAVTAFRLVGELQHWSNRWFSTDTGGIVPDGVSWVIGITWMAPLFGIYFAWRLATHQRGPTNAMRAVGCSIGGLVILILFRYLILPRINIGFPQILIFVWIAMAVPALLQAFGWPALFKTLLAYALAARGVVVIVMFFAMRGDWGTHYDYVGMPAEFQMPFWPRFIWLAFFPQLIFWVAFTILTGALTGTIAGVLIGRRFSRGTLARKASAGM